MELATLLAQRPGRTCRFCTCGAWWPHQSAHADMCKMRPNQDRAIEDNLSPSG